MRVFLSTVLIVSLASTSFAQQQDDEPKKFGPRRQLATIIFAGLGGAVLGLSTLSFYGRPQDKLSNIAFGFALGVIGGTIYATYSAAAKPQEFYNQGTFSEENKSNLLTQRQNLLEQDFKGGPVPTLGLQLSF